MADPCPPGCEDATRDGLALIRAALADDREALAIVGANLADPVFTALALADWLAAVMREIGQGEDWLRVFAERIGLAQG